MTKSTSEETDKIVLESALEKLSRLSIKGNQIVIYEVQLLNLFEIF